MLICNVGTVVHATETGYLRFVLILVYATNPVVWRIRVVPLLVAYGVVRRLRVIVMATSLRYVGRNLILLTWPLHWLRAWRMGATLPVRCFYLCVRLEFVILFNLIKLALLGRLLKVVIVLTRVVLLAKAPRTSGGGRPTIARASMSLWQL